MTNDLSKVRAIRSGDLVAYIEREWGPNDFIGVKKEGDDFVGTFSIEAAFIRDCLSDYDEDEMGEAVIA